MKFLQVLLGDEPVLEPHERLYQRLLSSSRDEADSVLQSALRESSILEVCDAIIVPAMMRANEDHDHGSLTDARRQAILEHINDWVDERLESMTPIWSRFSSAEHPEVAPVVICVPALDREDEIIAKLLEAALMERHLRARIIGSDDVEFLRDSAGIRAVVISSLPPEAVTAARGACKRIRAVNGEVRIFVGIWNAVGDLDRARQRLTAAGATHTVISFAECFDRLEGIVGAEESRAATGVQQLDPAPT